MKLSVDRILTTHVGSLPRPDDLFEMMLQKLDGKPVDERAYAERVQRAVSDSVRQQVGAGLDVISDGEMGKPSFITYATQRLSGLETRQGVRPSPFSNTRETKDFPEYYQSTVAEQVSARRRRALMVCTGPITYKGHDQLKSDLEILKTAMKESKRRKRSCPRLHLPISRRQRPTNTIRRRRLMFLRSQKRCAKNIRRSSMPGSSFRSTIRFWSPITSPGRI